MKKLIFTSAVLLITTLGFSQSKYETAMKEKIELMGFVGHEGSSIQEPTRTSYASWAIDGLCMRAAQGRQPPTYQLKVAAE